MPEWPSCCICHRELSEAEQARYVCRICQDVIGRQLAELPNLYAELGEHLEPASQAPAGYVTGGPVEAPLPLSESALSLTAAGGILTVLATWERDWREELGWDTVARPATLATVVTFLRANLLWAVHAHYAIDEFAGDVRRLHRAATRATSGPVEPPADVGRCPRTDPDRDRPCGGRLELPPGGTTVRCSRCHTGWGELQWLSLRRAIEPPAAEPAAA
ncbi:hypothetical protein [Streptomyces sp. CB03911]|uniref:zinc finger domain-containing protein n=1 Tax=Streptomyces sp. CB03911 TaxID=1804758 RepID=UPI00093A8541|nr:hypothetical protein [Streptomyces sp. CB03911]OKI22225.1 hypothetical protein A6A07_34695 [Streptomyces sp. CB03911]